MDGAFIKTENSLVCITISSARIQNNDTITVSRDKSKYQKDKANR